MKFQCSQTTLIEALNNVTRAVPQKSTISVLEGIKFYYGASHARLIARFYKAVAENTDDYIHISEGAMVVRLMDSIFRSANTGALVEV